MGVVAVDRAVVDAADDRPVFGGLVGLRADDAAREAVGSVAYELTADERLVE